MAIVSTVPITTYPLLCHSGIEILGVFQPGPHLMTENMQDQPHRILVMVSAVEAANIQHLVRMMAGGADGRIVVERSQLTT